MVVWSSGVVFLTDTGVVVWFFLPILIPPGIRCPLLLMACFLSLLSRAVTFLPEGVIEGFQNFVWGFKSNKNKIWGKNRNGLPDF
jgi:hypothetical protein